MARLVFLLLLVYVVHALPPIPTTRRTLTISKSTSALVRGRGRSMLETGSRSAVQTASSSSMKLLDTETRVQRSTMKNGLSSRTHKSFSRKRQPWVPLMLPAMATPGMSEATGGVIVFACSTLLRWANAGLKAMGYDPWKPSDPMATHDVTMSDYLNSRNQRPHPISMPQQGYWR
eukprot:gnl/TRDRNA2_/TRDRNA2_179722_c0_seq1.p1 gnl/TRDRNA2_/TRDRNA2_179722_c0~~gnl/TRDRNA2_/TRDRNA2_179722_c0_seq1.p1  ORF type:complete len:175 (+),score=7.42 gnl/TRDRNA2_/TRDRNA2_179722_c0_seq1:89-613(+)